MKGDKPVTTKPSLAEHLAAVIAGKLRAPTNAQLERDVGASWTRQMTKLRQAGRLVIEIYAKNYRVFVLDGRRSKECPTKGAKPYRIMDKSGKRWLIRAPDGPEVYLTGRSKPRSSYRMFEYVTHRKPAKGDNGIGAERRDPVYEARIESNWITLLQGRRFEDERVKSTGRPVQVRGDVEMRGGGGSSAMCLEA